MLRMSQVGRGTVAFILALRIVVIIIFFVVFCWSIFLFIGAVFDIAPVFDRNSVAGSSPVTQSPIFVLFIMIVIVLMLMVVSLISSFIAPLG